MHATEIEEGGVTLLILAVLAVFGYPSQLEKTLKKLFKKHRKKILYEKVSD